MASPIQELKLPSSLTVKLATTPDEIEQALRLRYQVFIEEAGNTRGYNDQKVETDVYDAFCDHLVVLDNESKQVVGTYRLLPGERIYQNQGFYAGTEFDLSGFPIDRQHVLELGRSCIAKEYRTGKAIQMLWDGIAGYIAQHGFDYLMGCASLNVENTDELNQIYSMLKLHRVITDRFNVAPLPTHRVNGLKQLPVCGTQKDMVRLLPTLMKGYPLLGAEIAGEPAYDPIFSTIDFLIVLQTTKIERRYRKHFIDKNRRKEDCTN